MAFIPNENGTQVTVLLLNADHYHTSDGAAMQSHTPMLVVNAGSCTGDCVNDDPDIALKFYPDNPTTAVASLTTAVGNGSAWDISHADITIEKATSGAANLPAFSQRDNVRGTDVIPTTATERGDVSWIASLTQVCGSGCTLDSDVFDNVPPDIVAARFTLDAGELYTYSIARLGNELKPVHFNRLDGTGTTSAYVQAVAAWVGADIEVTGDSFKIVESKHSGGGRSMTLSPDTSGVVEVAVLNLPPFVPPASSANEAPQVGKHFEMYYELLQTPPNREARLVPRAGTAGETTFPEVTWSDVHPTTEVYSELLNKLRLDVGRSPYDRSICAPTYYP